MKYKTTLITAIITLATLPIVTQAEGAAGFVGLVGIPGLENNAGDLNAYINALYRMSISIAALLAVIKIIAAGAKYMLTDVVPQMENAKSDIKGALLGLLVVIGAVLILGTINPALTQIDFNVEKVEVDNSKSISEKIVGECQSGNCSKFTCDDGKFKGLSEYLPSDTPIGCKFQCDAAGGIYLNEGTSMICSVNKTISDTYKKQYEDSVSAKKCTGDECYYEDCRIYGAAYVVKSCENICVNDFSGSFDSTTEGCVLNGNKAETDKTYTCTGTYDDTDATISGVTGNDTSCDAEWNSCIAEGGYKVSSDGASFTCRIPEEKTCPTGQTLKSDGSCEDTPEPVEVTPQGA